MNRLRCAQVSSLASGANPYLARYSRSGLVRVDGQRVDPVGDPRLPVVQAPARTARPAPAAPPPRRPAPAAPTWPRPWRDRRHRRLPGPRAGDHQQPRTFQHLEHGRAILAAPRWWTTRQVVDNLTPSPEGRGCRCGGVARGGVGGNNGGDATSRLLLCLAGALLATVGLLPARAQADRPVVEVFEASGVLDAQRARGAAARPRGGRAAGGTGVPRPDVELRGARGRPGRGPGHGGRGRGAGGGVGRAAGRRGRRGGDVRARRGRRGRGGQGRAGRAGAAGRARAGSRPGRRGGAVRALRPPTGGPGATVTGAAAEAAGLADYQAESCPTRCGGSTARRSTGAHSR